MGLMDLSFLAYFMLSGCFRSVCLWKSHGGPDQLDWSQSSPELLARGPSKARKDCLKKKAWSFPAGVICNCSFSYLGLGALWECSLLCKQVAIAWMAPSNFGEIGVHCTCTLPITPSGKGPFQATLGAADGWLSNHSCGVPLK